MSISSYDSLSRTSQYTLKHCCERRIIVLIHCYLVTNKEFLYLFIIPVLFQLKFWMTQFRVVPHENSNSVKRILISTTNYIYFHVTMD
jgi:hypothetical protein